MAGKFGLNQQKEDFSLYTKSGNNANALTMTDLEENPEYVDAIRDYMVDRKGKQFVDKDAEDLVDAFTRHMRFFNTNEAVTISEAVYMKKADEDKRKRAGEAYKLYDKLGNVFVNDGLAGAVDGVYDYISSIATSPSTYFGLGAGKLVGLGAGKLAARGVVELAGQPVGTKAVKSLAQKAYKEAFKDGGKEAGQKAFADVVNKAAKTKAAYAAGLTGSVDAGVATTQDALLQDVEKKAGSRDFYDIGQTLFSFATAGLATGVAMRSLPTEIDKTATDSLYKKTRKARFQTQLGIKLSEEKKKMFSERFLRAMARAYKKDKKYRFFRNEAFKGEKFFAEKLAEDIASKGKVPVFSVDEGGFLIVKEVNKKGDAPLLKGKLEDVSDVDVEKDKAYFTAPLLSKIIGTKKDGTYILDLAKEAGISLPSGMNMAGKIAILLRNLDKKTALQVGGLVYNRTGIHLGDTADILTTNLSIGVSRSIQEAAQRLQTVQGNALNSSAALVKGNVQNKFAEYDAVVRELADEADPVKSANIGGYIQNTWKRLLVSAPQTTAANVFGFGQYFAANSVAEVLQGSALGVLGVVRGGKLTEQGGLDLAQSKALFQLQGQKLKNFLDPYATYDMYMEILEGDPKLKKRLLETFAGGVERTAERFDIDEANKIFRATEGYVDIANKISGVRLQDSVTKSQMFMNSLDKQLRLQKGMTFEEALNKGDFSNLDNDVIDKALDETLKSVFAFDYTKAGKPIPEELATYRKLIARVADTPGNLGSSVASVVENVSNTPGFGFILPFGRFMNNVASTAYHWNPITGALPFASAVAKGQKLEAVEAMSRGLVGGVSIKLLMDLQAQSEAKGLAWNELETGGGDVIDITNTFPFSLAMAGARYINAVNAGGATKELREDFLNQLAIGQSATDLQFGNDLMRIFGMLETMYQNGDGDSVKTLFNGMSGTVGNVAAGFTRPFDPVNRIVGMATGMDTAVDRRQADGLGKLSVNGARYVDNIIESLRGKLMGEELRVGIREGAVYDPSPIRTMTGVKVKQPRTYANMVFGMVNMPEWRVGMYSGIPEHDAFVNKVMTPLLEQEAELLLRDRSFKNASLAKKRLMADKMLQNVKKVMRDNITATPQREQGLNYRRKLLDRVKTDRMKEARRISGIKTPIRDMTLYETEVLEATIDIIKETE